ncbi:MAG: ABC transporter ATP-binding protein [Clostridiales bacterium]|nr:ABC transporter ATP-binding protein [Clostridiales bacterium]
MLEVKNFSKQYQGQPVKAVDDISFAIDSGEIVGFIGPNGAGKSTTIKAIVGINSIDSGEIYVDGLDFSKYTIEAKQKMGYVPDEALPFDNVTGRELVHFVASMYDVSNEDRDARLVDLAKLFDMTGVLDKLIKSYSHGMKQKIAVIAALIHNPKLWILDEPLTGLDPNSAYNLKQLMHKHCEDGNSVFFSSHVLEVVEKLCDRVILINKAEIILDCTIDELKKKQKDLTLEEFFIKVTKEHNEFLEKAKKDDLSVEQNENAEKKESEAIEKPTKEEI